MKLRCYVLLSNFAFKFNLRRYSKGGVKGGAGGEAGAGQGGRGRVATNQYSVTEYFGVSKAGGS